LEGKVSLNLRPGRSLLSALAVLSLLLAMGVSMSGGASAARRSKVYVCHATGSRTNPFVLVHVPRNSAHVTKHMEPGRKPGVDRFASAAEIEAGDCPAGGKDSGGQTTGGTTTGGQTTGGTTTGGQTTGGTTTGGQTTGGTTTGGGSTGGQTTGGTTTK
jgi:hypothetical protein